MNKTFYTIGVALVIVTLSMKVVLAQTATPQPTVEATEKIKPSLVPVEKTIENLKDKIATKVAELSHKNGTVVAGTVTKINSVSLEVMTGDEKKITASIDDTLTKFYSIETHKKKEIKLTDLSKNDYVIVSGPQVENTITANSVWRDTPLQITSGQITNVDKDNFSLDVVTTDKEQLTLDVETGSKQMMMDIKTLEIKKTGFSKIKPGDHIHFSTKKTNDKKAHLSVLRLLVIPQEYFLKK